MPEHPVDDGGVQGPGIGHWVAAHHTDERFQVDHLSSKLCGSGVWTQRALPIGACANDMVVQRTRVFEAAGALAPIFRLRQAVSALMSSGASASGMLERALRSRLYTMSACGACDAW